MVKILDGLGNKTGGVAISVGNIMVLIQFFQLTCIVLQFIKDEQLYLILFSLLVEEKQNEEYSYHILIYSCQSQLKFLLILCKLKV